jgi:undecaprenyl-diphosphatase
VALLYGVLVAWSRVFLGVHYPLDVLAGFALGVVVAGCVLLILHRCWQRPTLDRARSSS